MKDPKKTNNSRFRLIFRTYNIRIVSQIFFFSLFLLSLWASWTTRVKGYPVSRFLEMNPLISLTSALSTGYVYRYLGWSVVVLIVTLCLGRVFCSWFCPFGSLHQFVRWVSKPKKRNDDDHLLNRYQYKYYFKYVLLVIFMILAALGSLQVGLIDPISVMYRSFVTTIAPALNMVFDGSAALLSEFGFETSAYSGLKFSPDVARRLFSGSFLIGLIFLFFVGINIIHPRFFCRCLCPLGALFGLMSPFTLIRISKNSGKCTNCNACLRRCEGGADPHTVFRQSECFVCLNCLDDCPENALTFKLFAKQDEHVIIGPDLNKRQIILSSLFAFFTFSFLRYNDKNSERNLSSSLIRPPGATEEEEFLRRCIKCDQCINICPTNVLQPAGFIEAGFENIWTPLMNFNIGHCQLKCNLCSEICPTGAIRKITVEEKLGKGRSSQTGPIRLGTAFFDRGRCLPHAMQIPCVVCEEVCPTSPKAIQTQDEEEKDVFGNIVLLKKPFIVPDLCIGCGLCQTKCPVRGSKAVYVTSVGETRSIHSQLLLKHRKSLKP